MSEQIKNKYTSIRQVLLRWYRKQGRKLPWRETTDPYIIFLSELMLQQTQVTRGLIYFEKFINAFPNWEKLAKASRGEVLQVWSGLGYNRRAIFIHEAAKQIVKNGIPNSYEEWLTIKGVGKYTAAALTVFSLHKKAYPVDTNIRRVIGRLLLRKAFAKPKDDARIERALQQLMDKKPFHDIPQALFDLSTAYCSPKPSCEHCPLRNSCPISQKFIDGKIELETQRKPQERVRTGKKYPDRIYRGRILSLAKSNSRTRIADIGPLIDPTYTTNDLEWVKAMVGRMVKDGLIEKSGEYIKLVH